MELELQKSEDIVRYTPQTPKNATWEIVYDYSGDLSVFITQEEKDKFLTALANGANFVEVRGNVLSKNFLLIRHSTEITKIESKKEDWNNMISTTKSVVDKYEEHFKKVREERKQHETKN